MAIRTFLPKGSILRAEREAIVAAPKKIAVSIDPPKRKLGILEVTLTGKIEAAKILKIKCKMTTPDEIKKAKIALIPILASSFTAKIAIKSKMDIINKDPDVPNSNTCPATELITFPEKNEETNAITGKRAIGIKNFDFGIWIIPLERVKARNTAKNMTITVTKKASFEE